MSRTLRALLCSALTIAVLAPTFARAEEPEGPPTQFHTDLLIDFQRAGQKLVSLAEAIPAESFDWRPTDEVRTTSEVFMHVVGTNMLLPMALGAEPPPGVQVPEEGPMALARQWEAEITEKDDVVRKLKGSILYATAAMQTIEDLETEVNLFFPGTKRAYLLVVLTHLHEHLGQAIAYARSMGVVPPWSRPAPAGDEEGAEAGAESEDS